MSGGEKYVLSAALCLAQDHNVSLFWDPSSEDEIKNIAKRKFNFDLSPLKFEKNIFSTQESLISRLAQSLKYDYIFVLSDGSIPTLLCKTVLHFQSPAEWVQADSWKTKQKMTRVETIVCNSFFTKKYIDRKFKVHSKVVYPPVYIKETDPGVKKENIILNVGRYGIQNAGSSYKKQEVLIDVFKTMVDKGLKKWELLLAVSISPEDKEKVDILRQKAEGYPVTISVNIDNDSLWNLYAKAKIYWHASGFGEDLQQHPDRAEHFGISTVEAMGKGAVPIVINAGGQPEIVEDGKNGMLWNTEDELVTKTTLVIESPAVWKDLTTNAKESAISFSQHIFCQQIHKLFV